MIIIITSDNKCNSMLQCISFYLKDYLLFCPPQVGQRSFVVDLMALLLETPERSLSSMFYNFYFIVSFIFFFLCLQGQCACRNKMRSMLLSCDKYRFHELSKTVSKPFTIHYCVVSVEASMGSTLQDENFL